MATQIEYVEYNSADPSLARRSGRRVWLSALTHVIFSFQGLLAFMLAGAGIVVARLNLPDPDTWWHVAIGKQILSTGSWPNPDSYSFPAHGAAWIAYEWLGEVLMALAARANLFGLTILLLVLVGTFLLLLNHYCFLCSGNARAAFMTCAALLPLMVVSFRLRPQLLGYIFLLVTAICLERFRQGYARALWILPCVFLLWVNTHGTFVFGFLLLGLTWVSGLPAFQWKGFESQIWTLNQRVQLLFAGLLSVLALIGTPYGTRIAAYPFQMAFSQPVNIANINEWQPMPFDMDPGKLFVALLLLLVLALVTLRPKFRLDQIALLLFVLYAVTTHRRFVILFAVIVAPILCTLAARAMRESLKAGDRYLLNAVLMLLLLAGIIAFVPSRQTLQAAVAEDYPTQAVGYLREHPAPGPLFNEYDWGGYLMWSGAPVQKVFIDGRADIYEYSGVLPDYLRIVRLDPEALRLLRKYGIEACLIERNSPLATLLTSLPDWKEVYSDSLSSLFYHQPGGVNHKGGEDNVL